MKIGAIGSFDTYSFYNSVNRISPRESIDALDSSKIQSSKVGTSDAASSDASEKPASAAIYQREDYAGPSEAKVSVENNYHKQNIASRADDVSKLAGKLMDYMPKIMEDIADLDAPTAAADVQSANASGKVVISENAALENNLQNNSLNSMMENISLT